MVNDSPFVAADAIAGFEAPLVLKGDASQVGCRECIVIDNVGCRTCVTNLITHERVVVEGTWGIEHDEDGLFAELYPIDDAHTHLQPVDVESLAWQKVWRMISAAAGV